MHVKDGVAFTHLNQAYEAMLRCEVFMTEIHLEEAQEKIKITDYQMPAGLTLSLLLEEKRLAKIRKILNKSFGVDVMRLESFYPLIICNKIIESTLTKDKPMALDAHLWDKAKMLNMELKGIERVEDQVAVLGSLDINVQLKQLKEFARNVSKARKQLFKLTDLYKDQDINGIFKATKKSLGSLRHILLYKRNHDMINTIAAHSDKRCFYAMGAAHLAGQKGVLNLLKQSGFKIKAVL